MPSQAAVSTVVAGMFLTGCANSLLTKWQDKQCVEGCSPGHGTRLDFEQPVWQTLNMFIGEFLCCLALLWKYATIPPPPGHPHSSILKRIAAQMPFGSTSKTPPQGYTHVAGDEDEEEVMEEATLHGWRLCLMLFPAFLDICGTTLMNVGLILTPVSIYQMSRGALVLWVGLLSVIFLKRRLWLYQWTSLLIVTLGVCLVGLSGSLVKREQGEGLVLVHVARRADDDPAKVALGVALILFAQIFTATQYVVEEMVMTRYKTDPLLAVTLEGFFGMSTTLLAMPLLHIFFRDRSPYFDIPRGWRQITSNSTVMWLSFAICFSIGAFNFFGLSVTTRVSATTRSTVDTCRTLGIWIVSLLVGWEHLVWPFSLLQVAGFSLLVYGTFVFNGLIAPLFCPPPASVHLPHEPELEETGEVPAAAAQGRAGYDVVPTRDDRD